MKFLVKNEKDEFVEATAEQVMSPDSVLYNEQEELLSPHKTGKDPVEELTGVVKDLATQVGGLAGIKDKQTEMETKIAAYEDAAKRGFPLPEVGGDMTLGDAEKICAPFELARQGQRLTDKVFHPNYQITEEKRIELAKYFTLFLKASCFGDVDAKAKFAELYGVASPNAKTVIGDSGNTFPIPDIVDSEIMHFAREVSVILKYARVWDMISEKQSFPIEGTAVSVAWGNTTQESEPDISTEFELDAEELSAFSEVRNTTLADSRSDIVSWLTEALAEAAGQEIDNESFTGDGTDVCSGILTAACGYSVTLASGSTSFSQLDATKLSEMIGKLDGLKKNGARFWLSGTILHYIRSLKDSQNRPIFIETVGAPMSGTIWGYPYTEVVKLGSISDAANTAFMAFGNLRYFGVGKRLDSSSLSVDPYGKWTTNRTRFKLYQRWGLGIALANGLVRMLTNAS